jgi:hypothetical protein
MQLVIAPDCASAPAFGKLLPTETRHQDDNQQEPAQQQQQHQYVCSDSLLGNEHTDNTNSSTSHVQIAKGAKQSSSQHAHNAFATIWVVQGASLLQCRAWCLRSYWKDGVLCQFSTPTCLRLSANKSYWGDYFSQEALTCTGESTGGALMSTALVNSGCYMPLQG